MRSPRDTILNKASTFVVFCIEDGCYVNGTLYQQGQRWVVGCDLTCRCDDASAGRYRCDPKYVKHKHKCNEYELCSSHSL